MSSTQNCLRRAVAMLRLGRMLLLFGMAAAMMSACNSSGTSVSIDETTGGPTTNATVTSITVEPANAGLPRGLTRQFSATAVYSNGTKLDVTGSVTWTSSATAIATVSATGLVSAANLGTSTITATLGTVSGSTPLTVTAATLVSIGVTPAAPKIGAGAQQQLTATGIYTDLTTQNITTMVTWTSATPQVATVSNAAGTIGVATGLTAGTSTLTATLGNASGSVVLTVSGAALFSITVAPATVSLASGLTQQFTASGMFADGTQQILTTLATWSSSSTAATISNAAGSQGLATAGTPGTATITAAYGGVTGSAVLTVTPATLVSIAVTPVNASVPKAGTLQFTAMGTYTDGTTHGITTPVVWTSAAPATATISNAMPTSGLATGVAQGSTQITARSGAVVSPAVTLIVTPAVLKSIALTPVNPIVVVGATEPFVATGTYGDGTTMTITTAVTWASATLAVATISNAAGPPSTRGLATALAAGTTVITATDPVTGIVSAPDTLTVINGFAYATNFQQGAAVGNVSQYAIGLDGVLTPLPVPLVPAGYNPFSIAITPADTYAYVANYNDSNDPTNSTISQYAINPVTGALTPIGVPVVASSNPNSVTIDPLGRYVYVSNFNEPNVSQFVIQGDGTLANPPGVVGIGGAIFPAGAGPASLAITPAGTHAYVVNYYDGTVSQFDIDPNTGALVVIPNEPAFVNAQAFPSYVVVDPAGLFVFVANQVSSTISEYRIGADGGLTLTGTTAPSAAATGPSFIAIDPSGKYAYVANSTSDDVSQYDIVDGILTPMPIPVVTTGNGSRPYGLTVDSTGRFLYVADRLAAGVIHQFAINQLNGSLTPLPAPPANNTVPAGGFPSSIITTP